MYICLIISSVYLNKNNLKTLKNNQLERKKIENKKAKIIWANQTSNSFKVWVGQQQ